MQRSSILAAAGVAAVTIAVAMAWRLNPSSVPTAAADNASAQALLQRVDAARGNAGLDPTVARLLHDTAQELNAQAMRSAALDKRISALELARDAVSRAGPSNSALPLPLMASASGAVNGARLGAGGTSAASVPAGKTNAAAQRQREYLRLVAAGASETEARAMLAFVDEIALQEVEMRFRVYRASRDGNGQTRGTARATANTLMQELRRLGDVEGQLRDTFGEQAVDRYLYAKELPNRVRLSAVLPGSVAERAGLQAGDLLLSYDGHTVHSVNDVLRLATEGNEGENVEVVALRGNDRQQFSVPRGPLGFRGESASVNPAQGAQ